MIFRTRINVHKSPLAGDQRGNMIEKWRMLTILQDRLLPDAVWRDDGIQSLQACSIEEK